MNVDEGDAAVGAGGGVDCRVGSEGGHVVGAGGGEVLREPGGAEDGVGEVWVRVGGVVCGVGGCAE